MNNNELINYIKNKNYHITTSEYSYICSNCTSIDHIKYLYEDKFVLWTTLGSEIIFYVRP